MTHKVLVDCTFCENDRRAIRRLLCEPETMLTAVTVVFGEEAPQLSLEKMKEAALSCGISAPIAIGAGKPILETNTSVSRKTKKAESEMPQPPYAWDIIYEEALKSQGKLTVITLGPLTNLAIALFKYEKLSSCKAIKEQLALDTVESLKEKLESGGKLAEDRKELGEKWDTAQNAESEAKNWKEGKEETEEGAKPDIMEGSGTVPVDKLPKNPMDFVKVWKKSPMLALIVENPSAISGKGISLDGSMGKRKKEKGNLAEKGTESLEKLWLVQYLNYYLSCQNGAGTGGSKNHALDYELEYCIGGKATDRENLEQTVKELLLIREAGNFMAIMKDGKKKALALEMAAAAAGFTGIAPLVQAVQIGILLAWSYMESVLDVRCLLAGGKIPLVKEPSEWKSDVFSGEKVLGQKTEKEEKGLSYREYLQILLLTIQEETLAYRAMDMIEQNIRMEPGEGQFRMDYAIHGVEAEALYQSNMLFLGFVAGVKEKGGAYYFNSKEQLFYSRE